MKSHVVLGILGCLIALLLWRWSIRGDGRFPEQSHVDNQAIADSIHQHQIDITPELHGVTLNCGESHTIHFRQDLIIRNMTGKLVSITKVGKSCNCQSVELSKARVAPGELLMVKTGLEIVTKHPGRVRLIREYVVLHTDFREEPFVFVLEGRFIPGAYVQDDTVQATPNRDSTNHYNAIVHIYVNKSRAINIAGTSIDHHPNISGTISELGRVPVEDGTFERVSYSVNICEQQPTDLEGWSISFRTNQEPSQEVRIRVICPKKRALPVFSTIPERVSFGTLNQDESPAKKYVVLRANPGERLEFVSVSTDHQAICAELTPVHSSGVIKLECSLDPSRIVGGDLDCVLRISALVNGRLVDHRIPVTAFVRETIR